MSRADRQVAGEDAIGTSSHPSRLAHIDISTHAGAPLSYSGPRARVLFRRLILSSTACGS